MERKVNPLPSLVEQAAFRSEEQATDLTHAVLLRCRSAATGRFE